MMLGTDADEHDKVYYSTFLEPWLNGTLLDLNEQTVEQLTRIKDLPLITIVGHDSKYTMSKRCKRLVSCGNYLLACCTMEDGSHAVALRNLIGEAKDEFGRQIPFMMVFVCDKVEDADKLTAALQQDLGNAILIIGSLFMYNPALNCLQFDLAKAKQIVHNYIANSDYGQTSERCLRCMVVQNKMDIQPCLTQLGLTQTDIQTVYDSKGNILAQAQEWYDGTPMSSNEKTEILPSMLQQLSNLRLTDDDRRDIDIIKQHIYNIIARHRRNNNQQ